MRNRFISNPRIIAVLSSALVSCALLGGCDEPTPEPEPEPEPFALTVGTYDYETEVFQELADGAEVEVLIGFQGLVFIDLALLTEDSIPAQAQVRAQVDFRDTPEVAFSFRDDYLYFDADPFGQLASLRVPFQNAVDEIDRDEMTMTLEITAGDFAAERTIRLMVVNDGCVHLPDGTIECE